MLLAEPFEDALKIQSLGPVLSKAASMECISPVSPRAPDAKMLEELKAEPWYQGEMSRKEAEGLLKRDGDFLVRKSASNPGSFVLTGMHNGQAKHVLLVDPEGTVSTGRSVACTGHSPQQSPLGHCTGDHFPFSANIRLLSPDSHSSGTLETRPRGLIFRPESDY